MTMNTQIRFYSPDGADDAASSTVDSGVAAHNDQLMNEGRDNDLDNEADRLTAGHLTNTKSDAKSDGGDQANVRGGDSTILGAGGAAGGLSGDGERTNEYDAAVMGLDD
jgi:hypothetical protein